MNPIRTMPILLVLLASAFASATTSSGDWVGDYAGAGAIVATTTSGSAATFVDNGAVTCVDADGDGLYESGTGGTCVRFDRITGSSIRVVDEVLGENVAFQICVDVDGDGTCTAQTFDDGLTYCPDVVHFSHDSATGAYHNPLPVPEHGKLAWEKCGGLGFPGYVVITCGGLHVHGTDSMPHTHQVSHGRVYSTSGATGLGDYCGGPLAAKAYAVL